MMHFPRFWPRRAPEPTIAQTVSIDLRKFDSLEWNEVSALPKRLRRAVQADRKARITAALERVAQSKRSSSNV